MDMQKRRKRIIVAPGFQVRYVGTILLVAFIAALLGSITVYYTTSNILNEKLAAVYPQGLLQYILNKVTIALAKNISVLAVIIIIFAVIISHRIAGPIYRIKTVIREIGEGKLDDPVYLRKNDELHDLADEINRLRESLKLMLKK